MSKEKLQSLIVISHSFKLSGIRKSWKEKSLHSLMEGPWESLYVDYSPCRPSPPLFQHQQAVLTSPQHGLMWLALPCTSSSGMTCLGGGPNVVLTVGWPNLAICLHGLNTYSLLESTFEMALHFENIEVSKEGSEL